MAISLASLRRNNPARPPTCLIYGVPGVGKTYLAAHAPSAVFLQTEDGLGEIPADTFGLLRSYSDVEQAIVSLYNEEHSFKTVILDTADAMEPLVWKHVAEQNAWQSIETPGYGKGYAAALDQWRTLLEGLSALREDRGMGVIMLAHAEVKRFEAPDTEPYDRYQIKLHKHAGALITEWADGVLFAKYEVQTTKIGNTKDKKAVRGIGQGIPQLHTRERPAYLAKNRWSMPDMLPMEWNAVAACIPFFANQAATSEAA